MLTRSGKTGGDACGEERQRRPAPFVWAADEKAEQFDLTAIIASVEKDINRLENMEKFNPELLALPGYRPKFPVVEKHEVEIGNKFSHRFSIKS